MSLLVRFNTFMFKVVSTLPVLFIAMIISFMLISLWTNRYFMDLNYLTVGLIWGIALGRKFSTVI